MLGPRRRANDVSLVLAAPLARIVLRRIRHDGEDGENDDVNVIVIESTCCHQEAIIIVSRRPIAIESPGFSGEPAHVRF